MILFSWGTECFSMYSLKREEEKKAIVNPSHQAGEHTQLSSCRCSGLSSAPIPTFPLPGQNATSRIYNNVCLLLARTTGNRSPKEHLSSEPKIQISVHRSNLLLLAIPLHICFSSRPLQLAHVADHIRVCCVTTAKCWQLITK